MAEANCEVTYTLEENCCDVTLAEPPGEEPPPPEEPPPEEPPPTTDDDSGCPYYCGFGSPEGVQESTFLVNDVETDVIGGEYLQLDVDPTSHPWWAKMSVGGLTGWRPWAGLGSEGVQSYRIGDGSLATGDAALSFGKNSLASGLRSIAQGESTVASGARAEAFGYNSQALGDDSKAWGVGATATGDRAISIGNGNALGDDDIYIGWGNVGVETAHPNYLIGKNVTINNTADASSPTPSLHGGHIGIGEGAIIDLGPSQFSQTVIGRDAKAYGRAIVAIGQGAEARQNNSPVSGISEGHFGVIIGYLSKGSGGCIVAVGDQADVRGDNTAAVGTHARANDHNTAAFGPSAFAGSSNSNGTGSLSSAYGWGAQAISSNSSAYGSNAVVTVNAPAGSAYGPLAHTSHEAAFSLGYGALSKYARVLHIGSSPDEGADLISGICFNGSLVPGIIVNPDGTCVINDVAGSTTSVQQPIAANRTLGINERSMMVNAFAAARTITLAQAAGVPNLTQVYIIKTDANDVNPVHIAPFAGDTIDGSASSYDLTAQWKYAIMKRTSATNWTVDWFN